MNDRIRSGLFLLLTSTFAGCERTRTSDAPHTPPPTPAVPAAHVAQPPVNPPPPSLKPKPLRLTVKGFFIGMKMDAARAQLINSLEAYQMPFPFSGRPEITSVTKEGAGFLVRAGHRKQDPQFPMFFPFASLVSDADLNVIQIDFSGSVVDAIFKGSEIPAEEFAKTFMQAYGLSKFHPLEEGGGWSCITRDGTKVTITNEKQLQLKKAPTAAERKASFD